MHVCYANIFICTCANTSECLRLSKILLFKIPPKTTKSIIYSTFPLYIYIYIYIYIYRYRYIDIYIYCHQTVRRKYITKNVVPKNLFSLFFDCGIQQVFLLLATCLFDPLDIIYTPATFFFISSFITFSKEIYVRSFLLLLLSFY